jgi:zinc transport system ATP-binding protein
MYSAIRELNLRGTAVIMVSHDLDAALKYGTHVLHLAHKPKFFGKTEEYLKSDAILTLRKEGRRYAP